MRPPSCRVSPSSAEKRPRIGCRYMHWKCCQKISATCAAYRVRSNASMLVGVPISQRSLVRNLDVLNANATPTVTDTRLIFTSADASLSRRISTPYNSLQIVLVTKISRNPTRSVSHVCGPASSPQAACSCGRPLYYHEDRTNKLAFGDRQYCLGSRWRQAGGHQLASNARAIVDAS
jgi:hypothetical protein